MTKPLDPYSRIYWKVLRDARFTDVRSDMRHFGSWSLMLVVADMAYPAPAFVPPTVPRTSLRLLSSEDCGLIELLGGGLFLVRGMKAERERRWNPRGTAPDPDGTPTGPAPDPERSLVRATDETRRDKTRKDETSTARDDEPVTDEETDLFAYIAQRGAFIRPDSGFGRRLLGLMDRRGADAVVAEAKALYQDEPMSDRQWVFGLEKALEAIPSPPMDELPMGPDPKAQRRDEQVHRRRLEYFQMTGTWDPDLGPEPEWQPAWGERPKVAA